MAISCGQIIPIKLKRNDLSEKNVQRCEISRFVYDNDNLY